MDTKNFKTLTKLGGSILALLVLGTLIFPFFNTKAELSLAPEGAFLTFEGQKYQSPAKIRLRPGEYSATLSAYGFKTKKVNFKVGNYGTTKASLELKERHPDVLTSLPRFVDFSTGFLKIDAAYGELGEPTYVINSFGVTKETALNWLKANGAELKDVGIEFIEDGD